jgi:hypothetical protein
MKPKKYYLIQLSNWTYPHWMQQIQKNGENWFVNDSGGGFPAEGIQILNESIVDDELDLDWSMSKYFNYKLDYKNGWLSPFGDWTQCQYHDHIDVAYYVLKSSEGDLENKNYIKISDSHVFNTRNNRYTRKQIDWLKNHDYEDSANIFEDLYLIIEN